jgi:hypothetical protein
MMLGPRLRRFALTVHIASSVGWLGAAIAYLVIVITALVSRDAQTVRTAWFAMEWTGWFAIVPLALVALVTGLVQALGTPWGLFRHYWVLFKFLLTVFAAFVLFRNMPTVSLMAVMATETGGVAFRGALWSQFLHAGGGVVVLLVTTTLSVYKPRGLTRYGWNKQHEERGAGESVA